MSELSEQTLCCFTHGLAHLIDELGYEQGLALAGKIVFDLAAVPEPAVATPEAVAGSLER